MPREYCHIEDNRDFHAERPNQKWVTDISYIKTGQGVLYLSVIRDLFFSILKTECIYRAKIHTYEKARLLIGAYIYSSITTNVSNSKQN